jgi:hypothetical protein
MDTNETYLPIPGWPNYEVSNLGNVRNKSGRVLRPFTKAHSYLAVDLHHEQAMKRAYVHRLVLEAFVGPCPAGCEASHANDIPTDNRLANLKWASHSHNISNRRHSSGPAHSFATLRAWSTRRANAA